MFFISPLENVLKTNHSYHKSLNTKSSLGSEKSFAWNSEYFADFFWKARAAKKSSDGQNFQKFHVTCSRFIMLVLSSTVYKITWPTPCNSRAWNSRLQSAHWVRLKKRNDKGQFPSSASTKFSTTACYLLKISEQNIFF